MQKKERNVYIPLDSARIAVNKCNGIQYTEYCHGLCNRFARRH